MTIRMDKVLWEFGKLYYEKFAGEHPSKELSVIAGTIGMLLAFEATGFAVRHSDTEGNVTWRATRKFLDGIGREAGPLVAVGPGLH
jgi:hypothetical protein